MLEALEGNGRDQLLICETAAKSLPKSPTCSFGSGQSLTDSGALDALMYPARRPMNASAKACKYCTTLFRNILAVSKHRFGLSALDRTRELVQGGVRCLLKSAASTALPPNPSGAPLTERERRGNQEHAKSTYLTDFSHSVRGIGFAVSDPIFRVHARRLL